ncbi:MAG: ASCH domain-containing protein [Acholeplasmataceae bacterium]|nr:ASCH domain-containing protein [Acholeplasmataceae bacterium]
MNKIQRFWETFLKETKRDSNTTYMSHFYFELTEYWANELLRLVLIGQKQATASSYQSYMIEGEPLPKIGDLNIVTDFDGNPQGVIETTQITILPFKDLTFEIVKREGEDDTLESWQKGHIKFFQAEGQKIGYTFDENMLVVFEDFKLIYKIED